MPLFVALNARTALIARKNSIGPVKVAVANSLRVHGEQRQVSGILRNIRTQSNVDPDSTNGFIMQLADTSGCYPKPANDVARVAELRSYAILDTPPELQYDEVVAAVRRVFEVPIVLISLVADDFQWFKSKVGLEACSTPRDISFCTYAILDSVPFVVENALLDERFQNNPLVTGHPNIRFYAGAPLITTTGQAMGSICAIDSVPRKASSRQLAYLTSSAKLIAKFLEVRRVLEAGFRFGSSLADLNKGLGDCAA